MLTTILIILLIIILLGGGGGYYGYRGYGGPGLGGALGLVIVVLLVLWRLGLLSGGVSHTSVYDDEPSREGVAVSLGHPSSGHGNIRKRSIR